MDVDVTVGDMVREPHDEFASFLMRLRKGRGVSARKLSQSLGFNEAYVYQWEHEPRRVNREVLDRIARLLEATPTERRDLFRLADMRGAPDSVKHLYDAQVDPDQTLLEAILERPHNWPSEPPVPNAHSERAQPLLDAMAWTLAKLASRENAGVLDPFTDIMWPRQLRDCAILSTAIPDNNPVAMPQAIVEQELPFIDQLRLPVSAMDAATQSIAMARAYRRLLFSDRERARKLAESIEFWEYDRHQLLSEAVSIRLSESDLNDKFGMTDVSCRVVASVTRRSLAGILWLFCNGQCQIEGREAELRYRAWHCVIEPEDWTTLSMASWIESRHLESFHNAQELRDSIARMKTWAWPFVVRQICEMHNVKYGSDHALIKKLNESVYGDSFHRELRQDPWRLAAVPPDALLRKLQAYNMLVPPFDPTKTVEEPTPKPKRSRKTK